MAIISPAQLAASGSEDGECKALMQWCALNKSRYPQLRLIFHIPNGGARDIREGAKFKALGVKRGIPDYFFAYPTKLWAGLWIEMKNAKGETSPEQDVWLADLSGVGYKTAVCYSWQSAVKEIEAYLNEGKR